jgi:hypothetical protein
MRARNIKPGFFLNCELSDLSFAARLLFIGLWCYADREGRFEWKPKQIKATIFPYDNVDIEELLCNLMSLHFITRNDGTGYVEHFKKHQNPHPHEAKSILPQKPEQNQCHDKSVTLHGMSEKCNADIRIEDIRIEDCGILIPDSEQKATRMMINDFRTIFFQNFGSVMPGGCNNIAHQLCQDFTADRITESFELAAKQGIMNIAYVEGILKGNGRKSMLKSHEVERNLILAANAESCREFAGGM